MNGKQKRGERKKVRHPQNEHFQIALNNIRHRPVCQSTRLALACMLTHAALSRRDAAVLDELSTFFQQTSRRWSKIYYLEKTNEHHVGSDTLQKVSVECKRLSAHFSGNVESLTSDNNDEECYEMIASITQFCTKSEKVLRFTGRDIHATKEAILMSYRIASSTIASGLKLDSSRSAALGGLYSIIYSNGVNNSCWHYP